jgi:glycosyltransferase involved in cell wall biosynthesis
MPKVLIFESHPVQYKAPVYQELNRLAPDGFEVIYATDASIRPENMDVEFGEKFAWDVPLLEGYPFRVLGNETRLPFGSPTSLSGRGVFSLLRRERPTAIVLTSLRYRIDQMAYLSAVILRIPILIRQETQDEMYAANRSRIKEYLRFFAYRVIYAPVQHAFAFGKLNYSHLTRHGISPAKISFARFSVPNAVENISESDRFAMRKNLRDQFGITSNHVVLGFVGKLIAKKNPDLLYEALQHLPVELRRRLHLLFVGSGQLRQELDRRADAAASQWGVRTTFAGFVNQSQLAPYYLAVDILILPSRQMGEAWGLVVNEALHAGCAVIITDAVGCYPEFRDMERVRVIRVGSEQELATAIEDLTMFSRSFRWAEARMSRYSTAAAAAAIRDGLAPFQRMESIAAHKAA